MVVSREFTTASTSSLVAIERFNGDVAKVICQLFEDR